MSTPRDRIRDFRQKQYNRAKAMGINVDEERKREKHTERTLALRVRSLMNDQAPIATRNDMVLDDPPLGPMDSANTSFTLSDEPIGETNIHVIWHSTATNTAVALTHSNSNPPPTGSFYWSQATPQLLVVADAPAPGDALFASFRAVR
jgi:hypothetical protein